MWYVAVLRILRRRFVLALIFFLSLTYCLVNLFGNGPLSKDIDEIEIHKREQPLIWREDIAVNATSVDGLMECRNSIQGRALIVDDEGFVCPRSNLMKNGCCQNTKKSKQYSCKTCNDDGCCGQYEYCVSCCLKPEKRTILEQVLNQANGRQTALFATVKDQFELCMAKCRTDSYSVQHENKYKNPETKYCYALTEAHESQRDNRPNSVH